MILFSSALASRLFIRFQHAGFSLEKVIFCRSFFSVDFTDIETGPTLAEAIELATFPDISGKPAHEREKWFDEYLTAILRRDLHMITKFEEFCILLMLRLLASRTGELEDDAAIAHHLKLDLETVEIYRSTFRPAFLSFELRPWRRNDRSRTVKSSKGYIADTLLLRHLLDRRFEDNHGKSAQLNLFDRIPDDPAPSME